MSRTFAATLLVLSLLAGPAFAAGGTSSTTATEAAPATVSDLWAAKWGDLGAGYTATVALIEAGKYDAALQGLDALGKPDDPRVLNWTGFITRKMGKPAEALAFYDKAIGLAPDFTPAYEYRGEAHLMLKDLAKAKADLAMIEQLCGNTTCEEHTDLAADIKTVEGGGTL